MIFPAEDRCQEIENTDSALGARGQPGETAYQAVADPVPATVPFCAAGTAAPPHHLTVSNGRPLKNRAKVAMFRSFP